MYLASLFIIASRVLLTTAAPATPAVSKPSTKPIGNIHLAHDEVLLHGNGRFQIMKRSEVDEINAARAKSFTPPKPGYLDDSMYTYMGNGTNLWDNTTHTAPPERKLEKRGKDTIIIPFPSEPKFMGWDVAMSPVVKGGPEKETSLSVAAGSWIANTISVGSTADFKLLKTFLSLAFRVDYGKTWTSIQQNQITSTVPAKKWGVMVSNPWTYREKGYVWEGRIGESEKDVGQLRYYYADRYTDKSYQALSWVEGQIGPCIGTEYPLKRCVGEGTF